jgi:hypothetical protein
MSLNAEKCFTLHISKKRNPSEYNYLLHNQVLEVTKDSKYIGVTINKDLSWANHISNITAKANRTIDFLRRNIHACLKEVKAAVCTTLVRPPIEYASAVWDPFHKNQISHLDCIMKSCTICFKQLSRPIISSSYIYDLQLKMGIP